MPTCERSGAALSPLLFEMEEDRVEETKKMVESAGAKTPHMGACLLKGSAVEKTSVNVAPERTINIVRYVDGDESHTMALDDGVPPMVRTGNNGRLLKVETAEGGGSLLPCRTMETVGGSTKMESPLWPSSLASTLKGEKEDE